MSEALRDSITALGDFERVVTVGDLRWTLNKFPELADAKIAVAGVGEMFAVHPDPGFLPFEIMVEKWTAKAGVIMFDAALEPKPNPDDGPKWIKTFGDFVKAAVKAAKKFSESAPPYRAYDNPDDFKIAVCDPTDSVVARKKWLEGRGPFYNKAGINRYFVMSYGKISGRKFTGVALFPDYSEDI